MSSTVFKGVPETEVERLRRAMDAVDASARIRLRAIRINERTRYAPYLGEARVGRVACRSEALDQASALQKRLDVLRGRRERACMTCARLFLSEGHHNRLCDHCRTHANDAGMF